MHSRGTSLQSEACPENAARERTRVRTLRQAFLARQAALPAVPPDTKLSKLDVLVLATSYIAHLTRTLGHELPGPAGPPFLRGLRYLHPLKVGRWPRVLVGNLGEGNGIGAFSSCSLRRGTEAGYWGGAVTGCCLHGSGLLQEERNALRFLVSGKRGAGSCSKAQDPGESPISKQFHLLE